MLCYVVLCVVLLCVLLFVELVRVLLRVLCIVGFGLLCVFVVLLVYLCWLGVCVLCRFVVVLFMLFSVDVAFGFVVGVWCVLCLGVVW